MSPKRDRSLERVAPAGKHRRVPQRPVLILEQHQLVACEPRRTPRVVDQHQRLQAVDLRFVRHQLSEHARQPDRLGGQVDATAVSLVVDQVDDREYCREPIGQEVVGGNAKRDPGLLDLELCARQAALHRLLRDDERACDLLRRQSGNGAEGERHLRLGRERRVAAREDQLEALVLDAARVELIHRRLLNLEQPGLREPGPVAADPVDRTVAAGRDQPRHRIGRDAVARPPRGRDRERLLGGLLGEVEIAEEADQGREHPAPGVAERPLDFRHGCLPGPIVLGQLATRSGCSTIGRTSTDPPIRAAGTRAATPSASSRLSRSNR